MKFTKHASDSMHEKYVFFLIGLCTLAGASGLLSISSISSVSAKTPKVAQAAPFNPADLQIAPYSDTHITAQAIQTNPTLAENFFHADMLAAASAALTPATTQPATSATPAFYTGTEYGTWLWTSPRDMSEQTMKSIIEGAKENGINVIYLSIDTYLDEYNLPDGTDKTVRINNFTDKLETFVKLAANQGIAVDAEAGWRNWAEPGNTYKSFAILNFVKQFNVTQHYKLRGFQYDVEPYLLPQYASDQSTVLTHFLALIDQTVARLNGSSLTFSVVIPDFFDDSTSATKPFVYGGTKAYTYDHLLSTLEKRPNSAIIIMAYRNVAKGTDGSIDISSTEMSEASVANLHTHVIIAQETGDVLPPYITFNNTNKKYLDVQVTDIRNAFSSYKDFGGIAIHYVNAYLDLANK